MRTISLRITNALLKRLDQAARKRGHNKSDLIQLALEKYLNGQRSASRRSFLDAAGDLIGCGEGPDDLSCDPVHMAGFGLPAER
jgi:hypothetical protein